MAEPVPTADLQRRSMQGVDRSPPSGSSARAFILAGDSRGQIAKHGKQDGRSVQNTCVAWAKRYRLIHVRLCPSKVEPVNRTQEAACGVAHGQSWSERDGPLCSRKRRIQRSRGPESCNCTLITDGVERKRGMLAGIMPPLPTCSTSAGYRSGR
jgi:hypothetical protein